MPMPIRRQTLPWLLLLVLTLGSSLSCASPAPAPDEAQAFMDRAEQELLEAWIESERAAWVQANFITLDTDAMAAATRTASLATAVMTRVTWRPPMTWTPSMAALVRM